MRGPTTSLSALCAAVLVLALRAPARADDGDEAVELPAPAGQAARIELGLYGGALVSRGTLPVAPLAGLDAGFSLTERFLLYGGCDYALFAQQRSELFSPPSFPRAQGELIQSTQVFTAYAGAGYRLIERGPVQLTGLGALTLSLAHTELDAFAASTSGNDLGPGVLAGASLQAPAGPMRLRLLLSWREALHDLTVAGGVGEAVVSGLTIAAGVGLAL